MNPTIAAAAVFKSVEALATSASDPNTRELFASLIEAVQGASDSLIRPRIGEFIVLRGHHDSIPLKVGSENGHIRLSEWWLGWSVKWYSLDEKKQFPFVEGPSISEEKARKYFEKMRKEIQGENRV